MGNKRGDQSKRGSPLGRYPPLNDEQKSGLIGWIWERLERYGRSRGPVQSWLRGMMNAAGMYRTTPIPSPGWSIVRWLRYQQNCVASALQKLTLLYHPATGELITPQLLYWQEVYRWIVISIGEEEGKANNGNGTAVALGDMGVAEQNRHGADS